MAEVLAPAAAQTKSFYRLCEGLFGVAEGSPYPPLLHVDTTVTCKERFPSCYVRQGSAHTDNMLHLVFFQVGPICRAETFPGLFLLVG